ncbi:MAG: 50S ribosomal protein L21 [Bacteroidales bacterium]|nr:50S ribosomal protein L21 [Bacteroidales bacterium]
MYTIVDIAGQQFKVEKGQEIFVNRLDGEEGSKITFSDVLLIDNNGKIDVGTPLIEGASVSAKIISHLKGDKVLVFKKKRRKGYKKTTGHRDYLTKILIENIKVKAAKPKKAAEQATEVKADKEAVKTKKKPAAAKKTTKAAAPKAKAESVKKTAAATTVKKAKAKAAPKDEVKKDAK